MSVSTLLETAVAEHRAGRFEAAARGYRSVLQRQRDHVDALHLLALAERDAGNLIEARALLERVVQSRPGFAAALGNLGMVCAEQGETPRAIEVYRRALQRDPGLVETHFNLANALRKSGDRAGARVCVEALLRQTPLAAAHHLYGSLLLEDGEFDAAAREFEAAVARQPDFAACWHLLGRCHAARHRLPDAIACLHRACREQPDLAEAHNDLGNALKDFGRPAEAVVCYERALAADADLVEAWNNLGNSLAQLGRGAEALRCYRTALQRQPDFADAHLNLGNLFKQRGLVDDALFCFREALRCRPGMAQAHNNLGVVLTERGRHAEAIAALMQALTLQPDFAEAHNNLGNVYKNEGRLELAIASFGRAVELRPDYSGAHSNLLFTLAYVDGLSPARIFELHRDWGRRHAQGLARRDHANGRDPRRRLRIAYVSPDFRSHACAFFIEPLLRQHDRTQVEVHAYAEVAQPDAVTQRLQGLCEVWRSTVGLTDEQVAALIRADGIDVLIDLAGHTANGRLLALARKPAPVQVEYLGYPATTGIEAMDWRLTDAVAEPPGQSEAFYTERLFRLPHSLWCYQPFADMGEIGPSPAQGNGYVTFGSFNNYAKVGPRVVALWAQVMKAVPDARLVMITVPKGEAQEALWVRFEEAGVARERVLLHDRLARREYVALFAQVDVALDPFPCNGGTTTCDALWMGLPVVALRGGSFLSRASLSVLTASGLEGFAADDEAGYVELCRRLAADPATLTVLRAGLRDQLAASPLLDAACFTRDLEAAYRAMWAEWCAGGGELVAERKRQIGAKEACPGTERDGR